MSNTTLTTRVSGRMSSRGWAIALGVGAIVLAAVLLVVYLDRYRARVGGENAPTPVLVAKQVIKQGTPGALVASGAMYQATTLPKKEVELGAISDPMTLAGRAAAMDIFPGAQLTDAHFAAVSGSLVQTGSRRVDEERGSRLVALGMRGAREPELEVTSPQVQRRPRARNRDRERSGAGCTARPVRRGPVQDHPVDA